jgi:hypothetical protein
MANVISADSGADKHYKHSGFSSTILSSYASPSTYPSGICWDGRYAKLVALFFHQLQQQHIA